MNAPAPSLIRLVAAALLGAAMLFAIVIATGQQTLSGPGSAPAATIPPAPTAQAQATTQTSGAVVGEVIAAVHRLSGHTWRFRYTVRATGKLPIAGFQISGPSAHLFNLVSRSWNAYGTGVCHTTGPQGLLVYWSTHTGSGAEIQPGKSAVFGFDANTGGAGNASYALSYGTATPKFGQVQAPLASTLAPSVPCK